MSKRRTMKARKASSTVRNLTVKPEAGVGVKGGASSPKLSEMTCAAKHYPEAVVTTVKV